MYVLQNSLYKRISTIVTAGDVIAIKAEFTALRF